MLPTLTILAYLLAGSWLPAGALVQETSRAAATERSQSAGLKVAVDPATGQIISEPTEADLEALAEGVRPIRRPSPYLLQSFELDHGGEGVFLDGWADHALEVKVGADGTLQVVCAQGDEHDSDDRAAAATAEGADLR